MHYFVTVRVLDWPGQDLGYQIEMHLVLALDIIYRAAVVADHQVTGVIDPIGKELGLGFQLGKICLCSCIRLGARNQ